MSPLCTIQNTTLKKSFIQKKVPSPRFDDKARKRYFKYIKVKISQSCRLRKISFSFKRLIFGAKVGMCVRVCVRAYIYLNVSRRKVRKWELQPIGIF